MADNTHDMWTKGRGVYGSRSPHARITEEQVVEMRRRYAAGDVTQHELAEEFGVNQTTISRIIHLRRWKRAAKEVA
jgi:DNA invertase Pin-like site-specific DNA recombinase